MPVLRYHRHKDPSPILNTEWFSWPGLPTTSYRNVIAGRATLGKPTSAMSLPPQPTGTDNAPTNMTKNASQSMTDNDVGYFGDSTNLNGITTVNTSTCNVRIQRRTCRRVRASELDDLYQRMWMWSDPRWEYRDISRKLRPLKMITYFPQSKSWQQQ